VIRRDGFSRLFLIVVVFYALLLVCGC